MSPSFNIRKRNWVEMYNLTAFDHDACSFSQRKKAIFCPNLLANGCWVKWPASTYIHLALSASKFPKPVSRVPTFCIDVQHFHLLETCSKWDSSNESCLFYNDYKTLSLKAFQRAEKSLYSWNRNTIWQFISVISLLSSTLWKCWSQPSEGGGWRHLAPLV